MTLGSILQFFVSHILVWITNQSKQLFKLLIPKRLCAFAGIELKGWVRFSLTPMTAFHQRTGFVPGARWTRLEVAAIFTSLLSACCWCPGFAVRHLYCLAVGNISKGMVTCLSNKYCLGKVKVEQFSKIIRNYLNTFSSERVFLNFLTLQMSQWSLRGENSPTHNRVKLGVSAPIEGRLLLQHPIPWEM